MLWGLEGRSKKHKNITFVKNIYIYIYKGAVIIKMLEMAVLETQIFKIFWGSMPPDYPIKLAPIRRSWCYPPFWKSKIHHCPFFLLLNGVKDCIRKNYHESQNYCYATFDFEPLSNCFTSKFDKHWLHLTVNRDER